MQRNHYALSVVVLMVVACVAGAGECLLSDQQSRPLTRAEMAGVRGGCCVGTTCQNCPNTPSPHCTCSGCGGSGCEPTGGVVCTCDTGGTGTCSSLPDVICASEAVCTPQVPVPSFVCGSDGNCHAANPVCPSCQCAGCYVTWGFPCNRQHSEQCTCAP